MMSSGVRPFRIMIVDDEKEVCSLLEGYFEGLGFETAHAYNGEEALDLLESFEPDCILLDVRMPQMDGKKALRAIMALTPDVPVIMTTAVAKIAVAEECLGEGAFAYITKPIDLDNLEATVKKSLDIR